MTAGDPEMNLDIEPSMPPTPAPPARASFRRRWLALALAATSVAIAMWLIRARSAVHHGEQQTSTITVNDRTVRLTPDAPQWQYIELSIAEEGPPLEPLPAPARIAFDETRTSSVGSPLPGRIEQLNVRLGDVVKKGDRLFSVRSGSLAEVERGLASAAEAVTVKKRIAERSRELLSLRAVPEKDVLGAESELKEAELSLAEAQAKKSSLAVASDGSSLFWVKAPRAGTVVSLEVYANQEVSPSADHALLRISDLDEVLALADVQERDAIDLQVGSAATIHSKSTGITRQGVLDFVSQVVDPQRHTVQARVRLPNKDRILRPNAFIEVTFHMEKGAPRVRVADEGVVSDGPHTVVFVLVGPGHLKPFQVETGRQRDGLTEIRNGLEPGVRYARKGALLLLNQVDLAQ